MSKTILGEKSTMNAFIQAFQKFGYRTLSCEKNMYDHYVLSAVLDSHIESTELMEYVISRNGADADIKSISILKYSIPIEVMMEIIRKYQKKYEDIKITLE